MRLSEFRTAVDEVLGAHGRVLVRDLVLLDLDGRTAEEALAAGVPPRAVWLALAREADVPRDRWYGVGQRERRR